MLDLDCREIFFGGAKGPGKTDLLLMAALRWAHVPGFAALVLRNSTKEALQANSIMDRLMQWTANTDAKWNLSLSMVRFPSGAMIKFGYIDNPLDAYQYQSSEYQMIIWDELTQFRLGADERNPYLFMFGMNRVPERNCPEALKEVPLQILSASNPGGHSHLWVRDRFITDEAIDAINDPTPKAFYSTPDRCFVPGRITDNPAINAERYIRESLSHLPPVMRERYVNGDWTVIEDALIKAAWLNYYQMRGQIIEPLNKNGALLGDDIGRDERDCVRIATIDPAGTSEDRAKEKRGKPPSWTVAQVWDLWPGDEGGYMFLRHVWRERVGFDGLCDGLRRLYREWSPSRMMIENEKLGQAAWDVLHYDLPIECCATGGKDKVIRAAPLMNKLERGEVFLPKYNNEWLPDLESEWLGWSGQPDETCDQIDTAAYAAGFADELGPSGSSVVVMPSAKVNLWR